MESFACQLQTLLVMGEIVEAKEECERAITALVHAWGVDRQRTIKRLVQDISKQIQQPLIEYMNPPQAEQEVDQNTSRIYIQKGRGPSQDTPRTTRLQNVLTPLRAIHRRTTAGSLPLREIPTPGKKSKDNDNQDQESQHPDDLFAELDLVKTSSGDENEHVSSSVITPLFQHVARGLSFGSDISPIHTDRSLPSFDGSFYAEIGDDSRQEDSNSPTKKKRQTGQNRDLHESLMFQEVDAVLEEEEAERKRIVANDGEESKRRETEQKQKDAFNLLSTVTRLAAMGSGTIRATMMAILVGSMKNGNARAYLIQNGFSDMRQVMVIKRKKETNEKRRKAQRTTLESADKEDAGENILDSDDDESDD